MTEHELRLAMLADIDQPFDARQSGFETPREAAFGAASSALAFVVYEGLLCWVGICHGNDGLPAGTPSDFSAEMAPIADLWMWAAAGLLFLVVFRIVSRLVRLP